VAGQKLSMPRGEPETRSPKPVLVATAAEIRQTLAWQTRRLDFDATPLGEIVTEINRYNRHQIIVADPRLNERRFGGSFPATDYETFVRMLTADFAVVAERRGDETWLRLKGP
jgi:transmembrane sensor